MIPGPQFSRRTEFEALVDLKAAQLRRAVEAARRELASRHEIEVLEHVLAVVVGLAEPPARDSTGR